MPLILQLRDRFRFVAFDSPGFGLSDRPAGSTTRPVRVVGLPAVKHDFQEDAHGTVATAIRDRLA